MKIQSLNFYPTDLQTKRSSKTEPPAESVGLTSTAMHFMPQGLKRTCTGYIYD